MHQNTEDVDPFLFFLLKHFKIIHFKAFSLFLQQPALRQNHYGSRLHLLCEVHAFPLQPPLLGEQAGFWCLLAVYNRSVNNPLQQTKEDTLVHNILLTRASFPFSLTFQTSNGIFSSSSHDDTIAYGDKDNDHPEFMQP